MKKIFTLSFILLTIQAFSQGGAQSVFRPALVTETAYCTEFEIIAHNTFINNFSVSTLKFIRIENALSPYWASAYCDCELCHDELTDSATFFINAGDSCVPSAHFYPHNAEGTGVMKVKVFDPADRTNYVIGEYRATCELGSFTFLRKGQLEVSPNPANSMLNIQFGSAEPYMVNIVSADGRSLMSQRVDGLNQKIDISPLKTGIYLIKIESAGKVFSTRFIKL